MKYLDHTKQELIEMLERGTGHQVAPMYHYIIARRDLHYTNTENTDGLEQGIGSCLGVTAAQVTHAAGESYAHWAYQHDCPPKKHNTIAVVLGVPNERALKRVEQKLKDSRIPHIAIHEPDAPWNGAMMTIGLYPVTSVDRAKLKPIVGRLKLL